MTHTPGPWSMSEEGVIESPSHWIASMTPINREANSQLIVSAPDLLAMCKAANLRLLQQKSVADDMELLDDLQAAIAKAEGK